MKTSGNVEENVQPKLRRNKIMVVWGICFLLLIVCVVIIWGMFGARSISSAIAYLIEPDRILSIIKGDCNGKHEWRGGYYAMYACSKCGDRWEESETRCKYCNILKKDETVGRYKHRCSGFRRSDDNTAWVDNERGAW